MKLVKWSVLAVLVATVALALVGSSSASAAQTLLCKVKETPCAAASRWPENFLFELKANNPKFLSFSPTGEVVCEKSNAEGRLRAPGKPLKVEISTYTFTNCKFGATACKVSVIHLAELGILRTENNLGEATFVGAEYVVECGILINCVFGGEPAFHALGTSEPEPAMLTASAILTPLLGTCPSQTKFSALFNILSPEPAYISA